MAPRTTAKKGARTPMSAAHKQALAEGREQGRAVRRYLEALEAHKPKRGRKRTPDSIQKRLAAIDEKLAGADALTKLQLRQERIDLEVELETMGEKVDLSDLEAAFVEAAAGYGARKGISYEVWRASGVSADVLRRAGIARGRV